MIKAIDIKRLIASLVGFIFTAIIFAFLGNDVLAAGYGWVNPNNGGSACGNGLSAVRFETRRRDNDQLVNTGNITAEVIGKATLTGVGSTATSGCVYNPFSDPIRVNVDAGGGYQPLFTQFYIYNPAGWTNQIVVFHIHVQPMGEAPAVDHVAPGNNTWINYDPQFTIVGQNLVTAHGATALTKLYFDIQGPTNIGPEVSGSWPPGNITAGPFGLSDGWYNWGVFLNDNLQNFSVSAFSSFRGFGIDRVPPVNVRATHNPPAPTDAQQVTVTGYAEDALSGLDYIQVFVDDFATPKRVCDFNGEQSGSCPTTGGPYAALSTHNYRVVACDRAGNCASADGSFTVNESTGRILGRIWRDDNGNQVKDAGEPFIQVPGSGCTNAVSQSGFEVEVIDMSLNIDIFLPPNQCNSDPYYISPPLPAGRTYWAWVNMPSTWAPSGIMESQDDPDWGDTAGVFIQGTLPAGVWKDIWFGVRPRPDLVPQIDFPANNSSIPSGTSVTFQGTIKNIGPGSTITASQTRFLLDGSVTWWRATGVLGPGASEVETAGPWTASIGSHTLELCADKNPDDGIGSVKWEVSEQNNCTSITFTVSGPDLIARNLGVNGALVAGSSLTFSGQIYNQGGLTAGASTSRFRLDIGNNGTWDRNPLSTHPTGALAPSGGENETSAAWTAQIGTHRFELCADRPPDPNGVVVETDEANNCATYVFSVTAPDLVAQNLGVNGRLVSGTNLSFFGTIKNIGNGNAGVSTSRFRLDINNNGTWDLNPLSTHPTGSLAPNGTELETSSNWLSIAGTHRFELCADRPPDPNGVVVESNELNNCTTYLFTVVDMPDLIAENLAYNGLLETGEKIGFQGVIRNVGTAHAGVSTARFCVNNANCLNSSAGGLWSEDVPNIGASNSPPGLPKNGGAQFVTTNTFWTPTQAGSYTATLCADVPGNGVVVESNEGAASNCTSIILTVIVAPPKPWIKTDGGDVGARGTIDVVRTPPGSEKNASYLVIAESLIDPMFLSAKNWLVQNYGTIEKPSPVGALYTTLRDKYPPCGRFISFAALAAGCNIVEASSLSITSPVVYNGQKAIVFVQNQMNINNSVIIGASTGIVFIVGGNVQITAQIPPETRVDGFYIVDGNFRTQSVAPGSQDAPVRFNGSVIGALAGGSNLDLRRDLRFGNAGLGIPDNNGKPAEYFHYEPKYLWLFRELIGETKTIFREVAP